MEDQQTMTSVLTRLSELERRSLDQVKEIDALTAKNERLENEVTRLKQTAGVSCDGPDGSVTSQPDTRARYTGFACTGISSSEYFV